MDPQAAAGWLIIGVVVAYTLFILLVGIAIGAWIS